MHSAYEKGKVGEEKKRKENENEKDVSNCMKVRIVVFLVMTPCRLVHGFPRLQGPHFSQPT